MSNCYSSLEHWLYSINVLVDQIGTVLFIALIWVTVKTKALHSSTCHVLIGVYAFCCLCSKLIILFPYLIFMHFETVTYSLCLAIEGWTLVPYLNIQPLMLLISVDRLLSILFPIWYISRHYKYYVPILVLLGSSVPLYLGSLMIRITWANPNGLMTCDMGQIPDPVAQKMPLTIINYLSSLSSTVEVPAIFLTSTEHRNGFKKEFNWLLKIFKKQSANTTMVQPVQVVPRNILSSTVFPTADNIRN